MEWESMRRWDGGKQRERVRDRNERRDPVPFFFSLSSFFLSSFFSSKTERPERERSRLRERETPWERAREGDRREKENPCDPKTHEDPTRGWSSRGARGPDGPRTGTRQTQQKPDLRRDPNPILHGSSPVTVPVAIFGGSGQKSGDFQWRFSGEA
jgi:hypothetical protein